MNNDAIRFTLLMPPSSNQNWKKTKHGMRRSDKSNEYRKHVKEMLTKFGIDPKINVGVDVNVHAYFYDRRKHDTDNLLKVLFDALTEAGFWNDDDLVIRHCVEKHVAPNEDKTAIITVEVRPMREWE